MSTRTFFCNDTATTEIYTLSLHDALPILVVAVRVMRVQVPVLDIAVAVRVRVEVAAPRSEEHTSELQSQSNLVCRLLLEKKKYSGSTTSNSWHGTCGRFRFVNSRSSEHTS